VYKLPLNSQNLQVLTPTEEQCKIRLWQYIKTYGHKDSYCQLRG